MRKACPPFDFHNCWNHLNFPLWRIFKNLDWHQKCFPIKKITFPACAVEKNNRKPTKTMKKSSSHSLLVIALVTGFTGFAGGAKADIVNNLSTDVPTVDQSHLINFYSFNGNANDSINGNHFSSLNSNFSLSNGSLGIVTTVPEWPPDGYAQTQDVINIIGNHDRTLSFWYQASYQSDEYINSSDLNAAVTVGFGQNSSYQSALYEADVSNGSFYFHGYGNDYTASIPAAQDGWNMITLTYSSSSDASTLYMNGVLVDNRATVPSLNTALGPLYIAGIAGSSVGDLGIWNSALSADQVSSIYNSEAVPEPSILALFGMGAIGMLITMRRKRGLTEMNHRGRILAAKST